MNLANLITRCYKVEEGEGTVDGYNVASVTQQSLMRQIGIVPQDPFLFSGSIEDNIRYGNMEARRGGNLSTGQRQLICLARVILTNPPIMILDEATSNVDTNTERLMQQSLRRLIQGRTCLIIYCP